MDYLQQSEIVDFQHKEVMAQAKLLAQGCKNDVETAKACFFFVRDHIEHSGDYTADISTCKALYSPLLLYKHIFLMFCIFRKVFYKLHHHSNASSRCTMRVFTPSVFYKSRTCYVYVRPFFAMLFVYKF